MVMALAMVFVLFFKKSVIKSLLEIKCLGRNSRESGIPIKYPSPKERGGGSIGQSR